MPNLLQKASIVLTPTAYDDGKVLCAKPSEPPYGDFDFSRNSAATRVNAQGLVENVQILSGNLVQNGDFSEEGVQEISNGSFSQEGVEQITNGSFDTDTKWTTNTGWSISGGSANCDGTQSGNSDLKQQGGIFGATIDFVVGKTYKVNFDIVVTSGAITYVEVASGYDYNDITTSGNHTTYITAVSTNDRFSITANPDFIGSIDNVSVREVGQDWVLGGSGLNTPTIGSNSATITSVDSNSYIQQNSVLTSGKSYKISYEILSSSGSSVLKMISSLGLATIPTTVGTHTVYGTATTTTFYIERAVIGMNATITNISVKEVLQDWSVEDYGAVSPSAVITPNTEGVKLEKTVSADWRSSFLVQPISYTNGSQYKVTFKLKNGNLPSGGSVFVRRAYDSSSQNIASTLTLTNDWVEYTYYFVADSNSEDISFGEVNWQNAGVGQYFYIDDVSVIEITDDTNLPRINYEGFSYQDALGSEEIVNGDFSNGNANWSAVRGSIQSVNDEGVFTIGGTELNSLVQSNVFTVGKKYILEFYAKSQTYNTNIFTAYLGVDSVIQEQVVSSEFQKWKYIINPNQTNLQIGLYYNASYENIIFDNVSVKEYLGQEVVPDSGCGSWLFEPQSTNLFLKSEPTSAEGLSIGVSYESFDWGIGFNNCVRYPNNSTIYLHYGGTCLASTSYTLSYYIKMDNGEQPIYGTDFSHRIGNTLGTSPILTNMGNGVYRVSETKISSTSNLTRNGVGKTTSNSVNGFRVTALQLEQQSYATSYIPTSGSTVTRNQDVCANGGSLATINSSEGVLYAQISAISDDIGDSAISINNGGFTDRIWLGYSTAASRIYAIGYSNSILQFVLSKTLTTDTEMIKAAVKYKENDFALWVDGTEVATDNSGLTPIGLNSVDFTINGNGSSPFYGKTKAVAVWKEALSDQELADLTYPTPTDPTFTLDFDTIAEQFTFARGSEATYVDAQGLIQSTNEIGEELVVNGDFEDGSTGWNVAGGNPIFENSSVNFVNFSTINSNNTVVEIGKTYKITYTISNKVGNSSFGFFLGGWNVAQYQDVGTHSEIISVSSSSVIYIRNGNSNSSVTIDNVSVKEYTTATNTPRLDYSTGAEAFLLEPQSTNLVNYSSDFTTGTGWGVSRSTLDSNVLISPDGQQTASELTDTTAPGDRGLSQINSSLASNDYALFSMFLKAGTNRYGLLYIIDNAANINGGANSFTIVIDLQDGIITDTGIKQGTPQNTTYGIEDYNNGWYRVYIGLQKQGNSTRTDLRFLMYNTSTWSAGQGYDGDGTGTNYIWGTQLEALPFATSYIPSNGSQTTRNQETCINATPEINSEEGVLYFEGGTLAEDTGLGTISKEISISDGTQNNRVSILLDTRYNRVGFFFVNNGVTISNYYTIGDNIKNINKYALAYKNGKLLGYFNGVEVVSNLTITTPFANNLSNVGFIEGRIRNYFFGNTKDIQVYTKALSDAELIKLTT